MEKELALGKQRLKLKSLEKILFPQDKISMEYLIATKKSDIGFLANLNTISFHVDFSTIECNENF